MPYLKGVYTVEEVICRAKIVTMDWQPTIPR
jgi:hypothetical protein